MDDPLAAYRETLQRNSDAAADNYDNWVLKLSGGALAIALGFVRPKGVEVHFLWTLVASWGCFTLSMLMTLFSFRASCSSHERALRQVDDRFDPTRIWRERPGGASQIATRVMNYAAGALLLAGIAALASFVGTNLDNLR